MLTLNIFQEPQYDSELFLFVCVCHKYNPSQKCQKSMCTVICVFFIIQPQNEGNASTSRNVKLTAAEYFCAACMVRMCFKFATTY